MRQIISLMHVSLDGFAAGPNGEMDWIVYDNAIFRDAIDLASTASAAIYGRVTYEMMAGYWPTVLENPDATPDERHHAEWVENIPKIVVSRTLEQANWHNTRLIRDNVAAALGDLKQQPGGDMIIFGSPRTTHLLARLGLVDAYHLNISPVTIGAGTPLFEPGQPRAKLELTRTKPFDCGVIGLHYQVVR
jgi:dihydrofolate reductase